MIARRISAMVGAGLLLAGAVSADSYIVMAKKNLPADFQAQLAASGATLTAHIPEIGIAVVESADPSFAAGMEGIRSVTADIELQFAPVGDAAELKVEATAANPPNSGEDDFFFDLQWGHDAVDAIEAWNNGHRGAGARVAVLDSGMDGDHPDIAPNLNAALSASFVPGEDWNVRPGFFFNHGTHVGGTIAAADNGIGTIGVAPEAELVAVKVLSEFTGGGSFGGIIQGIVYAANIGSDVINMSLGVPGGIPHNVPGAAELFVATGRATTYAWQQGSLVISSAGNDNIDLDHNKSTKAFPAELPHVLSISATAPQGWALDPANAFFGHKASYSNYGQSGIDFSAPGGDYSYAGNEICQVGFIVRPCFVLDFVFSTISGGWGWSVGTSMAAPHAAGVAALIIGANGGDMSPAHVIAALAQGSDDLGKPGNDDVHGGGSVNANGSTN